MFNKTLVGTNANENPSKYVCAPYKYHSPPYFIPSNYFGNVAFSIKELRMFFQFYFDIERLKENKNILITPSPTWNNSPHANIVISWFHQTADKRNQLEMSPTRIKTISCERWAVSDATTSARDASDSGGVTQWHWWCADLFPYWIKTENRKSLSGDSGISSSYKIVSLYLNREILYLEKELIYWIFPLIHYLNIISASSYRQ